MRGRPRTLTGQELRSGEKAAPPDDRPIDGFDLSGLLFEKTASPRRTLFRYSGTRLFAARKDMWKLHLFTQSGYGQPAPLGHDPPLLLDLNVDPGESFDAGKDHPEVLAVLMKEIAAHRAGVVPAPSQLESVERPADKR